MLKLLDRLEKNKSFWFLFAISLLFFFLRLPSVIEPNWYGDEGIYQVIGMALNQDRQLYAEIWDNKPPLLYITYAFFQGNQFGIRIFSLLIGLLTVWTFFSMSQKLFVKKGATYTATAIFALLFSLPLLEANIANAENFMLLPILASALLVYQFSILQKSQQKYHNIFNPQHVMLGGAGFLLGVAFLIKSVAIFDFIAFFLFLLFIALPPTWKANGAGVKTLFHYLFVHFFLFIGAFLLPFLIAIISFSFQGTLFPFLKAAFLGNIEYVSYSNSFVFPQGLLILKIVLLITFLSILFKKRYSLNKQTLFVLIWLVLSLFNIFFSQRLYHHYLLVTIPSLCFFAGLLVDTKSLKKNLTLLIIFIITTLFLVVTFRLYQIQKTFLYYQNAVLFLTGNRDVSSYQAFFDQKATRDYELASLLKLITKPNETIFIWGDNPQIYALSNTLPVSRYTAAYHVLQQEDGIIQTQKVLDQEKPRLIIILEEAPTFPFHIPDYVYKFSFDQTVIYERSF